MSKELQKRSAQPGSQEQQDRRFVVLGNSRFSGAVLTYAAEFPAGEEERGKEIIACGPERARILCKLPYLSFTAIL